MRKGRPMGAPEKIQARVIFGAGGFLYIRARMPDDCANVLFSSDGWSQPKAVKFPYTLLFGEADLLTR
jgi:hypothetical protein